MCVLSVLSRVARFGVRSEAIVSMAHGMLGKVRIVRRV